MAGVLISLAGRSVLPLIGEATLKEGTSMIGKSIAIGTGSYAVRKLWESSGKKKRKSKKHRTKKHKIKRGRKRHGK